MKLFYNNNLSSLKKLASDIESFSLHNSIPPAVSYALNLCLDEVLTNVISYSTKNNPLNPPIEMDLSTANNSLSATIRDSGPPFNPLNTPPPSHLSSPLEDRPIGGLGIYFLEQYMDKVEYKRENDHNILILTKYIN